MSIAYLILGHKNARQIERLFKVVNDPRDLIILHFDKRADPEIHALGKRLAGTFPNVRILPSRAVLWSGFRMAAVQLDAMRVAHAVTEHPWHHFINITGQDFPIRSRDEILSKITEKKDASFLSWFPAMESTLWENAKARLERYYLEWAWLQKVIFLPGIGRRIRKILGWHSRPFIPFYKRTWPDFFKYYGGANHLILSRAAVKHLLYDPGAKRIIQWLSHSLHANEIVFQCALVNSPLAPTLVNANLRTIEFARPQDPHPRVWRGEDFDRLINSKGLFARKFDLSVDEGIFDKLEAHITRVTQTA